MNKKLLIKLGSVCLTLVLVLIIAGACAAPAPTPTPTPTPTPAPTPTPTPVAPPEKVYEWKMPVLWAKGSGYYQYSGPDFCNNVNEMANGELIITPYGPGELASALEYGDIVSQGAVELAMWHCGYWAGRETALGYQGYVPGAPMKYWDYDCWFWTGGGVELVREFYDAVNIHYVGNHGYSDLEPVFSKKPVNGVADFDGLKMRSSGLALTYFNVMGAVTVALGGDECYEALARGTLDAAEHTPAAMMKDMGIHEVTKYIIDPMPHQPYTVINYIANMDAWNELPAHLQEIVFTATRYSATRLHEKSHMDELAAYAFFEEQGMIRIMWSAEEQAKLIDVAMELWRKDYAEGSDYTKRTIKSVVDYMKEDGLLPADFEL